MIYFALPNSAELDNMLHFVTLHLDLHCLQKSQISKVFTDDYNTVCKSRKSAKCFSDDYNMFY